MLLHAAKANAAACLAMQAFAATGLAESFAPCLRKAHSYIDTTQACPAVGSLLDVTLHQSTC